MKAYGKKVWLIPDGFYIEASVAEKSHEAVCVINTSDTDAHIKLTVLFENREPIKSFESCCGARRTHHIRMDKIVGKNKEVIPFEVAYAILVESDQPIVCQYTRVVSSHPELALMTTMAYPVDEQ